MNLRGILAKIRSSIKKPGLGKKPTILKPAITAQGHFGMAFRDREMRRRREQAGLPAFTPSERKLWHSMPVETLQGFVYLGYTIPMHSSNVSAAKYDLDSKKLTIWFHGGKKEQRPSEYEYANVSENEAIEFAQYASKGGWVWSRLRIMGTKLGHRKAYKRVS